MINNIKLKQKRREIFSCSLNENNKILSEEKVIENCISQDIAQLKSRLEKAQAQLMESQHVLFKPLINAFTQLATQLEVQSSYLQEEYKRLIERKAFSENSIVQFKVTIQEAVEDLEDQTAFIKFIHYSYSLKILKINQLFNKDGLQNKKLNMKPKLLKENNNQNLLKDFKKYLPLK